MYNTNADNNNNRRKHPSSPLLLVRQKQPTAESGGGVRLTHARCAAESKTTFRACLWSMALLSASSASSTPSSSREESREEEEENPERGEGKKKCRREIRRNAAVLFCDDESEKERGSHGDIQKRGQGSLLPLSQQRIKSVRHSTNM